MTIKDFRNKVTSAKKLRDGVEAEIKDLLQLESVLSAEADAAAEKGNVDLYEAKIAERDKTERAIFVKRSFLDKMKPTYTADEALDAWSGYAADYNKKLKKARADFMAEKAKLLKLYADLLELQGEALLTRRELAVLVGLDASAFKMDYIPNISRDEEGSVELKSCSSCVDPDAVYYLASDAAKASAEHGGAIFNFNFDPCYETRKKVCDIILRRI